MMLGFTLLSFSKEKLNRDVDELHLRGKVKSVFEITTTYDTTGTAPVTNISSKVICRFNEKGNTTEVLYYTPADTLLLRKVSEVYKHNGQKRIRYVDDPHKHKHTKQAVYWYDKNGKLARLIYCTPAGMKSTVSEYDGMGNRCSVTQYSRHNGWPHKTRISYNYVYDSLGRLTEERNINEDGSLLNKYVHKYDKKGNEIETDIFNTDSTLSRKISAQFDTLGNPVDVNDAYYFIGGGDVGQKRNATYDDNGFKTEEETYRIKADGTVVLIKATVYENDKMGNWIKATSFDNNKKGSVETRVIDYY